MGTDVARPTEAAGLVDRGMEANAVSGPTPGTVISRRQVGSTLTSSSTRLVSLSTSWLMTSMTDSSDSDRLASTGVHQC
jgi:hypothetical protein